MQQVANMPGIITQKDIFRLSAVIYAESSDITSTLTVQADVIKCVLCEFDNIPMSDEEIINAIASKYKFYLSREEFPKAIRVYKNTFERTSIDSQEKYKLTDKAYEKTKKSMENNIDSYIDIFLKEHIDEDVEEGKYAIHKYLYELTTSNINSYKVLLGGEKGAAFLDSELSVDAKELNDHERKLVHDFISWENQEKNIVLTNLVYCCLEYCLLVNGDTVNPLLKNVIRKRTIYLDTNVIFRSLGINGPNRKSVMLSFLKKCKQARLTLVILHETEQEFEDTIKYYISQIRAFPRGYVYQGAIEQISDYNMFSFYNEWKNEHEKLSLEYFLKYIKAKYYDLCKEYGIYRNYHIPNIIIQSEQFKSHYLNYAKSIQSSKQQVKDYYSQEDTNYSMRDKHDAIVISYIEHTREKVNGAEDIFMASTDKALRYWDMTRNQVEYPIVVYPSQLFLILIKICGRSADDFESFVSFINIRPRSQQITAEKANVIIAGISSITEDIKTQKSLVEAVFGEDFQNIIQQSASDQELYKKVQTYSQNYLDDQLTEKDRLLDEAKENEIKKDEEIESLSKNVMESEEQRRLLVEDYNKQLADKNNEIKNNKERIYQYAAKKTRLSYILHWYIYPGVTVMAIIFYCIFIFLQFFFCDKQWNFATYILNFIADTPFGKNVDGYMAIIDGAVFVVLSVVVRRFWANPLNTKGKEEDRQKRINDYIETNHLC